jgi:hypothetical protein
MRLFLIVTGLLIGAWVVAYAVSDDFDSAGLQLGSQGTLVNGSKFGITVGMKLPEARQRLISRGLVFIGESRKCYMLPKNDGVSYEIWWDNSWRGGTMCLASQQGRVVALDWVFDPAPVY